MVNRVLTRFLGEIFAAVDAGTPLAVADSALDPLGLPMRPLALLQLVGRPWRCTWRRRCTRRSRTGSRVSDNLRRIAEAGRPLLVDGELDPEVAKLLVVGDSPLTAEQVRERALDALAQEIRLILDEGVVADRATSTCA